MVKVSPVDGTTETLERITKRNMFWTGVYMLLALLCFSTTIIIMDRNNKILEDDVEILNMHGSMILALFPLISFFWFVLKVLDIWNCFSYKEENFHELICTSRRGKYEGRRQIRYNFLISICGIIFTFLGIKYIWVLGIFILLRPNSEAKNIVFNRPENKCVIGLLFGILINFILIAEFLSDIPNIIKPPGNFYLGFDDINHKISINGNSNNSNNINITLEIEECEVQIFYDYGSINSGFRLVQGFQYQPTTDAQDLATYIAFQNAPNNNGLLVFDNSSTRPNNHKITVKINKLYQEMLLYEFPQNYECMLRIGLFKQPVHNLNITVVSAIPKRVEIMSNKHDFPVFYPRYDIRATHTLPKAYVGRTKHRKSCQHRTIYSPEECIVAYEAAHRVTNDIYAEIDTTFLFPKKENIVVKSIKSFPFGCLYDFENDELIFNNFTANINFTTSDTSCGCTHPNDPYYRKSSCWDHGPRSFIRFKCKDYPRTIKCKRPYSICICKPVKNKVYIKRLFRNLLD